MSGLRVLIKPTGPWFSLDDPNTYDEFQQGLLETLRQAGLGAGLVQPEGVQRLGALGLLAPAAAADAPPLLASMLAYRTLDSMPALESELPQLGADGAHLITPDRRVWVSEQRIPAEDETFRVLHIRYAIPAPDGTLVVLAFASPCLPEQELLEWLFDQMVQGLRFVEDEAPDTSATAQLLDDRGPVG